MQYFSVFFSITSFCNVCATGKSFSLPFSRWTTNMSGPLHLIESDLWGLAVKASQNSHCYYISFIDVYSRYTWIYFLESKSHACSHFVSFGTSIEKLLGTSIWMLQTNWGGEFQALLSYLKSNGITHIVTCLYTSQENRIVEWKHRHIIDIRSNSFISNLYTSWVLRWCLFLNGLHHQSLPTIVLNDISPMEKSFGIKPITPQYFSTFQMGPTKPNHSYNPKRIIDSTMLPMRYFDMRTHSILKRHKQKQLSLSN